MDAMTLEQHAASAAAAPGLSLDDIWRHLPLVVSLIGAIEDAAAAPTRQGGEVDVPAIKTWTPSGSVWVSLRVANHPPAVEPEPEPAGGQATLHPQVVGE